MLVAGKMDHIGASTVPPVPALLGQLAASYEMPDAAMRCRMELFSAVRRAGGSSVPIAAISGALSDASMDFLCDHEMSVRDFVELCGEHLLYLVPPPPGSNAVHVAAFRRPILVAFTRTALQHDEKHGGASQTVRAVPRAHLHVVAAHAALLECFVKACRRGPGPNTAKQVMSMAIAQVEDFEKYDAPHIRVASHASKLDRVTSLCMATHFNYEGKVADLDGASAVDAALNLFAGFSRPSQNAAAPIASVRTGGDFAAHVSALRAAASIDDVMTRNATADVTVTRELDLNVSTSAALVAAQMAATGVIASADFMGLVRELGQTLNVMPGYVIASDTTSRLLQTNVACDLLHTVLPSRLAGNQDPTFRYGFLASSCAAASIADLIERGVDRLANAPAPGACATLREMRADGYNYKRLPSVVRTLQAGGDFLSATDQQPRDSPVAQQAAALSAFIGIHASPEAICLVVAAGCVPTTLLPVTHPVVDALTQQLHRCLGALDTGMFFVVPRTHRQALATHAAGLRCSLSALQAEATMLPRERLDRVLALFSCPVSAAPAGAPFLSLREAVELVTVPAYVPTAADVAAVLQGALAEPLLDPLSLREEQLLRGEVQQSRSAEVLVQPGRIASNWAAVRQVLMGTFTFAPSQASWDAAAADPKGERHFIRLFPPFSAPLAAVFPATATPAPRATTEVEVDEAAGGRVPSSVNDTPRILPEPVATTPAVAEHSLAVADEAAAAYAPFQAEYFDALRLARCVQADAHMSLRELVAGGALFQLVNHDLQHVVLAHPEMFHYTGAGDDAAAGGHVKFIVNPNYRPTQSKQTKAELQEGIAELAAQIKAAPSSKRYRLVRRQKDLQRTLLRQQFSADHPCYDPNVVLQMAFDSLPTDGPLQMEEMWARMPRCARLGPDLSTRVLQRAPHLFYCFEMGEDPPRNFVQRADLPHPIEPDPAEVPMDDVLRMMIRICRFGEKDNRATNWSFLNSRLSKTHRARLTIEFGGDSSRATPKQIALFVARHSDLFRIDAPPGMSEADFVESLGRNASAIGVRTVKDTPRARALSHVA
jgi:hypothetical protein